ncbi:MAG: DUF4214 domain-containing protein [Clostridia bacterium]|nr:DUF4214 domain-containing protein [Clostridia bacterium]
MKADLDERTEFIRNGSLHADSLDVGSDGLLQYFDLYCDLHKAKTTLGDVDYSMEKSLDPEKKRVVDVNRILPYDDADFVKLSYLALFGRKALVREVEETLYLFRKGERSKLDILLTMAASDEGRYKNVSLTGIDTVGVNELLKFEDREFIRVAYALIFARRSDIEGEEQYLRVLREKGSTKAQILKMLRNSEEADKIGVTITGLDEAAAVVPKEKKIYTLPVIGKIARLLRGVKNLNEDVRTLKASDVNIYDKLSTRIATTDDTVRELKFNDELKQENIRNTDARVYELQKEVDELKKQIEILTKESR